MLWLLRTTCSSCFLLLPQLKGIFAGNVPDRYVRFQNWNPGDPAAFPDRCTAYSYFTSPTLQNGGCNEAYHLWLSIMRCQSWEKIKKGGSWWTSTPVCRGSVIVFVCLDWQKNDLWSRWQRLIMAGQDRDELTVGPRVNDGLVKCLNIAVMWSTPNVSTSLYALTSPTVI